MERFKQVAKDAGSRGEFWNECIFAYIMLPTFTAVDASVANSLGYFQSKVTLRTSGTSYLNMYPEEYHEVSIKINDKTHSNSRYILHHLGCITVQPSARILDFIPTNVAGNPTGLYHDGSF